MYIIYKYNTCSRCILYINNTWSRCILYINIIHVVDVYYI